MGAPSLFGGLGLAASEVQCLKDYTHSVLNPFDTNLNPCLPTYPALPSQRACYFQRGNAVIGTTPLIGFVAVAPNAAAIGSGTPNVMVTSSGFLGSAIAMTGTGILGFSVNSPFNTGNFSTADLEQRVVSAGLRIAYTGATINMSGEVVGLQQPHNHSLETETFNSLLGFDKGVSQAVDRAWTSLLYVPLNPTDLGYSPDGYVYPIMAFMFSGQAGTTFKYEFIEHVELIGQSARGKLPASAADSMVKTIISRISQYAPDALQSIANIYTQANMYNKPLSAVLQLLSRTANSIPKRPTIYMT